MNIVQSDSAKPHIRMNLFHDISTLGMNLIDLAWEQHRFHESRQWSSTQILDNMDFTHFDKTDRIFISNAGMAEITTKPGADRLAKQAEDEGHFWLDKNPMVSVIMQACGTWSRYWNQEESFHDATLNKIAAIIGESIVDDQTFIKLRQVFPKDNMLRTLVLLAFSEAVAHVSYIEYAKVTKNKQLANLLNHIGADEAQHMSYFITFAKALVDSGEYNVKDVLSVGYMFIKDGGELSGSARGEEIEKRDHHVNWWDEVDSDVMQKLNNIKKQKMIFSVINRITGISLTNETELYDCWIKAIKSKSNSIRAS